MFNYITLIFFNLIAITNASGSIEVILAAPNNAYVFTTICTGTQCNGIDQHAQRNRLNSNIPLKLQDGEFNGIPPAKYDLHLLIFNATEGLIGSVMQSVDTNTDWQTGIIKTLAGFNVIYQFRALCDDHHFGSQCNKFCQSSPQNHIECSKNGDFKCMQGWTGTDCMTPICSSNCNNNGKCVSTDKCLCNNGFEGADCSQCIPKPGCVHGSCSNNQSFTCSCHAGYGGELCNVNLDKCDHEHPCQNGGECRNDVTLGLGYQCKCSEGFVGAHCEKSIESVKCRQNGRQSVCLNDGICISVDNKSMECLCKSGFLGKQCEIRNGSSIEQNKPECGMCYSGENCEQLDVKCLVKHIKRGSKANQTKKVDEKSSNDDKMMWILAALVFSVLLLAIVVVNGRKEKVTEVQIVKTPTKSYKVYVIETSSPSHQHHHDPPPAYSPSSHKSLSTTDSLDKCFLHPDHSTIV